MFCLTMKRILLKFFSIFSGCNTHNLYTLGHFAGTGYLTACFALMVGSNGRTVGVEHIPELVSSSIKNIEKSAAAPLLKDGSLSVHDCGMVSIISIYGSEGLKILYFLHNNSTVAFYHDKHSRISQSSL